MRITKRDLEIEEEKLVRLREQEFLESKIHSYQREHKTDYYTAFKVVRKKNSGALPDFRPVGGLSVIQWDTGYMVFDMAEVQKLPKRRRDKILKLASR